MSKSLKRVIADAMTRGVELTPIRLDDGTTTAQQAADSVGCDVGQIVKSIVLRSVDDQEHILVSDLGAQHGGF